MKYLSDYTKDATSKALKQYGGLFAFDNKQFNDQAQKGVKYKGCGRNLYAPVDTAEQLVEAINNSYYEGIKQDLKENSKKKIVWRELANHEAQLGFDGLIHTKNVLSDYGITGAYIDKQYSLYYKDCVKNDYF